MKKILKLLIIFISSMMVYAFINDLLLYIYLSWMQLGDNIAYLIRMNMNTMAGLIVVSVYLLYNKIKDNKK